MPSKDTADLAIAARWIIPVEPAGTVLTDHALLVRDGRVDGIIPAAALPASGIAEVLERPEHALMPGLVNAHGHAAMTLLRTATGGQGVDAWLRETIWPLEAQLVDADFVADGTELAIAEMLLGGMTCHADMYYYPEVAARVTAASGMRGIIGLPVLDAASSWAGGTDEYFERGLALHDQYRDDLLVGTAFALHSPAATADATLARLRMLADQLQAIVMIHLLESPTERERVARRHGVGPLERLERAGLVNDLLLAVHGVQANASEIGRLAGAGASMVHCPASNLKLANGIAPVVEMRRAGLNVALGTDGASSNDALDLLGEARLAALLAAGGTGDAAALGAHDVLEMATLGGARALGLGESTGSLVGGKWADVACVRLSGPVVEPIHDVAAAIVHAAGRRAVTDVWVAGRQLVREGRLTRIDPACLLQRVRAWHPRVLAARARIAGQ